jgi:hypothetical protein
MSLGPLVNSSIDDAVVVIQLVRHAPSVSGRAHLLTDSKVQ